MSGNADKLNILTIEGIEQERVLWLAEPYIPLGKTTLVNGNPGVGKSTFVLAIAADMTNGAMFAKTDITESSAAI
jgi:MoxR-like ATPase